jgi:hypothetical protein
MASYKLGWDASLAEVGVMVGCALKASLDTQSAKRQVAAKVRVFCSGLTLLKGGHTAFVSNLLIRLSPYRIGHALLTCRWNQNALANIQTLSFFSAL